MSPEEIKKFMVDNPNECTNPYVYAVLMHMLNGSSADSLLFDSLKYLAKVDAENCKMSFKLIKMGIDPQTL